MKKTYLNELNFDEFCKVYHRCNKLQDIAYEYCYEDANYEIDDILRTAPKKMDYDIRDGGCYHVSWVDIEFCDIDEITEYLQDLKNCYGLFEDIDLKKYSRYSAVVELYDYSDAYIKYKDYRFCRDNADAMRKEIERQLAYFLEGFYDFDDGYITDAAYSCGWFNGFYVDENGNVFEERQDIQIA